jgi:excisionase family DNA binding protein
MSNSSRLTVAQAARALGLSERTLRRRVSGGKIEAVKGTTPETGAAWFIEQATVDALLAPRSGEEQKEDAPVLALVEPERSVEIARLRDDVQQIKAFLIGKAMAEGSAELPPNLGVVIGQAMRETLAPLVERIEQQSAENALLKQQLAESQARDQERQKASARRSWWPFPKRHE